MVTQKAYYILDYTLAQICALQFFKRMLEEDPEVWEDYLHLCSLGGDRKSTRLNSSHLA